MKRTLVIVVAFITIAIAACVSSSSDDNSVPAPRSVVEAAGNEDAGAVAEVTCDGDEVRVTPPVVRAHHDGFRLEVHDPSDLFWAAELHHATWDAGTAENIRLVGPVTSATSAIAPGIVTIVCLRGHRASYDDPGVPSATVTLVDPRDLYAPWDLWCGFGEQFRITVWAGEEGSPDEVFRRVPGIEVSDEFKPPKYPGSPQYSSIDRVVIRDGIVVARFMGPGIGPEWKLLVNACPESGIVPA